MDLINTLTQSKPVLVTKCSKCGLPLEVKERMVIGLGKDCEENAKKAFSVDQAKGKSLSGDSWFNFLALFGNLDNNLVPVEMIPTLERACKTAISLGETNGLTTNTIDWQFVLDCFSISRNSNDNLMRIIHTAMTELGFANFIALASGDFCMGTAVLGYDKESKKITLQASIRRSASEVFNLLNAKRPTKTYWLFKIKDAQIVLDTVLLRFLPDMITILPEFYEALELSKNSDEEEKENRFTVEDFDTVLVKIPFAKGRDFIYTKVDGPKIYPFMMDINGVSAAYSKEFSVSGTPAFIVKKDKLDDVERFLNTLQTNEEKAELRSKGKKK